MKLLVISLCTTGVMRDHFISYCRAFSKQNELYCITNDNVSGEELCAKETLNLFYKRQKKLSYFSLSKVRRIKRFVKSVGPDAVYVFTPHPVNILIARFLRKYKLLFQVHDPAPHSGTGFMDRVVLKMQLKRYYRYADRLVVAGEALKRQIAEEHPKTEEKISVVPFAVIESLQKQVKALPLSIDVLFFGRIEYYKGLDVLFEALELLRGEVNCFVIGRGDLQSAYGTGIKIPPCVTFLNDYIPDEALAEKIAQSKVVVMPYRDATGSMTVAQAFYYGKPVIATNVGVFPEYVQEGGIVVPKEDPQALANAIGGLLGDEERLYALSLKAKELYAEQYTLEHMAERMQEVFVKTIDER